MSLREWAVVWLSFLAINLVSLDVGMLIGVGVAVFNFMLSYVQVPVVNPRMGHSSELQALTENMVLTRLQGTIAHFEFRGYLFFGSVVQILEGVQKGVYVRKSAHDAADVQSSLPTHASSRNILVECLDGTPASNADASPTEFVVMDFSRVSGMDATAARGAFLILKKYCRNQGVTIVFSGVLPSIRRLLLKNEITSEGNFYATAESAIEFCEAQLSAHFASNDSSRTTDHVEPVTTLLHRLVGESNDSRPSLAGVDQFFRMIEVPAGHNFYGVAEYPNKFFFLARGRVVILKNVDGTVDPDKLLTQLKTIRPSSMFGEVAFFGQQRRHTAAAAMEPCTVYGMSREQFAAMKEQSPMLSNRVRDVVVQSMAHFIIRLTLTNPSHLAT
ncbi:unnamed protein product [Phytophthora fragariaefolia]|uniref:Unnamed protein product n=1 Tax=Phytophthora fragariaefolia TaxID=1490495 RepID=A0A9W7D0K1_9STRA|nr:unnamed protein product [Phytophthora fragariaefolia]